MVIAGGNEAQRYGVGTTTPGDRNKNSPVVMRRTDVPGSDHNQVVYERNPIPQYPQATGGHTGD